MVRDISEFRDAFRTILVDAALVDVGSTTATTSAGGKCAGSSIPDVAEATTAGRSRGSRTNSERAVFRNDAAPRDRRAGGRAMRIARMCDVLVDGVDESVARDLVHRARFQRDSSLHWRSRRSHSVSRRRCSSRPGGGSLPERSPVRTAALAREVGVSREHLSRHFSAPGAPNLKRVIDLVRMIGAAELAKNPGLDVRDVAKILGFASSSPGGDRSACARHSSCFFVATEHRRSGRKIHAGTNPLPGLSSKLPPRDTRRRRRCGHPCREPFSRFLA